MSINVIKLTSLLEEHLLEIGDLKNITPYNINNRGDTRYKFEIEDDNIVDVIFSKIGKSEVENIDLAPIFKKSQLKGFYNLGYSIKGISTQAKFSNTRELLKIMATLMEVVKDFLEGKELICILIFEENKDESLSFAKGQKSLLYKSIISQNLPKGYISGPAKFTNVDGLAISPKI